jgi:hypothetical protein
LRKRIDDLKAGGFAMQKAAGILERELDILDLGVAKLCEKFARQSAEFRK